MSKKPSHPAEQSHPQAPAPAALPICNAADIKTFKEMIGTFGADGKNNYGHSLHFVESALQIPKPYPEGALPHGDAAWNAEYARLAQCQLSAPATPQAQTKPSKVPNR